MGYRVVVVGAMSNVGMEILKTLAERRFPIDEIKAVGTSIATGQQVSFGEDDVLTVIPITDFDFNGFDFVFFSAGALVSAEFVPIAAEAGCVVIDNSSYYRQEAEIPLVIPEVNPDLLCKYKNCNIIASPNPSALSLALALKPLQDAVGIKRVVLSTYQSVSGLGRAAMDELFNQTRAIYMNQPIVKEEFSKQIAFNVIPQCDNFATDGNTLEENRIVFELQEILGNNIGVAVTCVRVPVFIGHSISVAVELEKPLSVEEARALWRKFPGVSIIDYRQEDGYATPIEVVGEETVFLSRIREDKSVENGLLFWVVSDNLHRGAALNAVQIAEKVAKDHFDSYL